MTEHTVELEILVAMDADKQGQSVGTVRSLKQSERTFFSIRGLATGWGLAVVSVFIPVLHFVLVPAFLAIGIVFASMEYRRTELLKHTKFLCPSCKTSIEIQNIRFLWPLRKTCPECQMVLLINLARI